MGGPALTCDGLPVVLFSLFKIILFLLYEYDINNMSICHVLSSTSSCDD